MLVKGMRQSYTDMITRLQALRYNGNPVFNNVAIYNDQVARMLRKGSSTNNLSLMPACYIEVVDYSDEQLSLGLAAQNVYINFHIIDNQLDAGDGTFDQNLEVFDLRTVVRKCMTGYNPTNFSAMGFAREKQDFKHDNIYHMITSFKSMYIDLSGCPYVNGEYILMPAGTWSFGSTTTAEFVPDLDYFGVGTQIIGSNLIIQ